MTQMNNTMSGSKPKKLASFIKGLAKSSANTQVKNQIRSSSSTQGMRTLIARQSEVLSRKAFKADHQNASGGKGNSCNFNHT